MKKKHVIAFGEKFDKLTDAQKIEHLQELAFSSNQALDMMQKERDNLLARNKVLEELSLNADNAISNNKAIMIEALTKQNEYNQSNSIRIQELEEEVKLLDKIRKML